jgi:phosphoribosylglycinamide formyltransferase 1
MTTNLAIFASGSGSNAENIYKYLTENKSEIVVKKILTNNPNAGVLKRFENFDSVEKNIFDREAFKSDSFLQHLQDVDYIILAGFLWLIPAYLIQAFPNKIINIHPSLLPKYGGKGMYGKKVHEAVMAYRETSSGITIHLVNEEYDKGEVLFQASCSLIESDTVESLELKIHDLEFDNFPQVIEEYINNKAR